MSTSKSMVERKGSMTVNPYGRLVSLPVHSENVFHFPEGLPAFENVKEFVFLCKPDSRPFFFMHALDPADLAFVCIDPFLVTPDYSPRIPDSDVKFLHLESPEEAFIANIVTVTRDMRDITVNLQGPIVVNIRASLGKQIICDGQKYPVRYRIWDALNKLEVEVTEENAGKEEPVTAAIPG
ncbi:MAG: flagellar assembly protein FliW [Spartobacteria bacterium]|nr:flagellar assembly protein FliW [Spartobacteria bacterium]